MISSLVSRRYAVIFFVGENAPANVARKNDLVDDVDEELTNPTDKRVFAISTAFHRGYSVDKIWQMTNIDKWFLTKLQAIYKTEVAVS